MYKVTVRIDGMMCDVCEDHICEAIKKAFNAENVTASHKKGEAVFETQGEISKDEMKKVIDETGYKYRSMSVSKASNRQGGKKSFFSSLFGK
ncbi:MAG: heavy-metal-associated domain-containing protein [Oscillospiraceae bacterium]